MTARPCNTTPAAATAPRPTPTGLVGADGYEAWVHLAMWCPQSLRHLEETTQSVPMHFWRLSRKIALMRETVKANLQRSHPHRSPQQATEQAAALVKAEWVTVPAEVPVPVWTPEPAMDTTSTQWRWWQFPGLEDGELWARKLLEAATDPDLTREELTAVLGPPPLPERLTEPLVATVAETGLWQSWEMTEFMETAQHLTAKVTTEWDRSMVAWDLAVMLEQDPPKVPQRAQLTAAIASRLLQTAIPPQQPPVVPPALAPS